MGLANTGIFDARILRADAELKLMALIWSEAEAGMGG